VKLMHDGAAGYFEKSRWVEQAATGERELIQLIENIVRKSREQDNPLGQTSHLTVARGS
jgi:hypothetical protein